MENKNVSLDNVLDSISPRQNKIAFLNLLEPAIWILRTVSFKELCKQGLLNLDNITNKYKFVSNSNLGLAAALPSFYMDLKKSLVIDNEELYGLFVKPEQLDYKPEYRVTLEMYEVLEPYIESYLDSVWPIVKNDLTDYCSGPFCEMLSMIREERYDPTLLFDYVEGKTPNGFNHDDCSICFGVQENEKIVTLRCKHSFHKNCLKTWFSSKRICPNCKQDPGDRIVVSNLIGKSK